MCSYSSQSNEAQHRDLPFIGAEKTFMNSFQLKSRWSRSKLFGAKFRNLGTKQTHHLIVGKTNIYNYMYHHNLQLGPREISNKTHKLYRRTVPTMEKTFSQ